MQHLRHGRNIPQVEQAVRELIRQRGLPRTFTGIIEYNGIKIIVRRPTSYTWEQNTQIQNVNLDYYKRLHGFYEQFQADAKEARADLKRACRILRLYIEGHSFREIAHTMKLDVATVYKYFTRTVEHIKANTLCKYYRGTSFRNDPS